MITLTDLKEQVNSIDGADDMVLQRLLAAATKHVERLLGYAIDDSEEFPDGTPADLELAILQLAADWYENREATLVGVTAQPIPYGVREIVAEYRRYTFGLCDPAPAEEDDG